jgi:TonB family protein
LDLSLNLAANHSDPNSLKAADFIFAGTVHLIVIVLIIALSWWQSISKPEPLKRIEIEMISAKDLKNMQIAEKMRSIQKKRATQKKPVLKLKAKPQKKKQRVEEAFDPFAPVQSESDVTTKSSRNDMADTIGKQLSAQEIERYIAMMKQAIQEKWKVASDVGKVSNPLVEVVLNPNGKVASARIIDSSGNTSLDQSLLAAIYAAQPFQVPPRSQFEPFRVNNIWFEPLK